MAANRKTIYISDQAAKHLADDESLSARINSIIVRYAEICRRHKPHLARNEWCAIFDALNGTWSLAEHADADITPVLWTEIYDADRLNGLGEKWGIDAQALAMRLRDMPYADLVSIMEHTKQFWRLTDLTTDEALARIGIHDARIHD